MKPNFLPPNRRTFIKTMAVAGAGLSLLGAADADEVPAGTPARKIKLGFDNFSVRAMGWKAHALLDYAASLKLDSILISDLDAYENFSDDYLKEVRAKGLKSRVAVCTGVVDLARLKAMAEVRPDAMLPKPIQLPEVWTQPCGVCGGET